MERDNAEEIRVTYIIEAIFGDKAEVAYGGDGRFMLKFDGEFHDIGRAQAEALFAAGYVIIGAHTGDWRSDEHRIENYSIASLDRLDRDASEKGLPYYGNAR